MSVLKVLCSEDNENQTETKSWPSYLLHSLSLCTRSLHLCCVYQRVFCFCCHCSQCFLHPLSPVQETAEKTAINRLLLLNFCFKLLFCLYFYSMRCLQLPDSPKQPGESVVINHTQPYFSQNYMYSRCDVLHLDIIVTDITICFSSSLPISECKYCPMVCNCNSASLFCF